MAHRRSGRASIQWLWFKAELPASPFIRFCLGLSILLPALGAFSWFAEPVLLAWIN